MKIVQYSHNDLDGKMSIIVGKVLAYIEHHEIEYHELDTEQMSSIIDRVKETDADIIIISDLGLPVEVVEFLDGEYKKGRDIRYYDHHIPKCDMSKYQWAHVYSAYKNVPQCGASIMYREIFLNNHKKLTDYITEHENILFKLSALVDETRMYDTYLWHKENRLSARDLSRLSRADYRFIENKYMQVIDNKYSCDIFKDYEKEMLNSLDASIKEYVLKKAKQSHMTVFEGYVTAVVYASEHQNEVGSYLYDYSDDIDIVALIDTNKQKVSLRSKKQYIDVSKIAMKYGGGGHKSAAGFAYIMTNKMKLDFFEKLTSNKLNIQMKKSITSNSGLSRAN